MAERRRPSPKKPGRESAPGGPETQQETTSEDGLLRLLETPYLERGATRFDLPSNVPGFLLAYLAVRGDWITRDALMALFWPDRAETEAQHNLRVNLHRAKKLLADWGLADRLDSEWRRIRLRLDSDVVRFRAAVGRADWREAVALHRAPLLSGLALPGFATLDEWASGERSGLLEAWRHAALRESERLAETGDARGACALLQAQLALNLLAEDQVQALLRVAPAAGERDSALRVFAQFRERLAAELGLEPMAETLALSDALRCQQPHVTVEPVRRAPTAPARLDAAPLVGRDGELARISASTRSMLVVAGEPGVGKTRLLEEALPDAIWLSGRDGQRDMPLQPVAETLDDLSAALESWPAFETHRRALAHLVPAFATGEILPALDAAGAARVAAAATAALRALGRPLVVDDLQWVDTATLALLDGLIRQGDTRLCATVRRHEIDDSLRQWLERQRGRGVLERIDLGPLDAEATQSLLARLSGAALGPPQFSAWLHRRTGGNPFFALETLRSLFESGRLRVETGGWASDLDAITHDYAELEIPPRVIELVQRRFGGLSDAARRALTIGCVAGDARHVEALATVAGLSPWAMAEAIAEAQRMGLLVERDFAHDLIREALYKTTPDALRSVLHASIARHCADVLGPHREAEHCWAAGQTSAAVDATLRAAEQDRLHGQQTGAIELLQRALQRVDSPAEQARLWLALGRATLELNQPAQAAELAQRALDSLPMPAERVGILVLLGDVAMQQGDVERAQQCADEAASLEPDRPAVLMLRALVAFDRGQFELHVQTLEHLLRLHRREAPGVKLVNVLTALGAGMDVLGQGERGMAYHREALATARALGARHAQVDVAVNMMWALSELGRTDEALAIGHEALALGRYDATPSLMNNLAWQLYEVGRVDEAAVLYDQLTREADPTLRCFAWAKQVQIAAGRGDRAATRAAVEAAFESLAHTDLYRAHAVVLIQVLEHGDAADVARAAGWLRAQPLDPYMQGRLDALCQRHGLRPVARANA